MFSMLQDPLAASFAANQVLIYGILCSQDGSMALCVEEGGGFMWVPVGELKAHVHFDPEYKMWISTDPNFVAEMEARAQAAAEEGLATPEVQSS